MFYKYREVIRKYNQQSKLLLIQNDQLTAVSGHYDTCIDIDFYMYVPDFAIVCVKK